MALRLIFSFFLFFKKKKCVGETIDSRWDGMKLENVLFILTVPAEYDDKAIRIMRECMNDAKLIDDLYSERLQFTTERKYHL